MADITNVLKVLPDISEMLYQMYKDETDKESISVRYDQYLAVDDALDLLKEQQPRILRLPEALGVYDPIVAEFKKPNGKTFIKWVDAVISQDLKSVDITDLYCNEPEERKLSFSFNLYNTMFRFWSVKPTEKQRKEEPWNGDFRYL